MELVTCVECNKHIKKVQDIVYTRATGTVQPKGKVLLFRGVCEECGWKVIKYLPRRTIPDQPKRIIQK